MTRKQLDPEELATAVQDHEVHLASACRRGRNLELTSVDLRQAKLTGLDLAGCALIDCDLRDVDLTGVDFYHSWLSGSLLDGAALRGADLRKTDLTGVSARGADLGGASLFRTWAPDADFRAADLSRTDLGYAELLGADLRGAHFEEADFDQTWLSQAVFGADSWASAFKGAQGNVAVWGDDLTLSGPKGNRALGLIEFVATVNANGARLRVRDDAEARPEREHKWRWGPLPYEVKTPPPVGGS